MVETVEYDHDDDEVTSKAVLLTKQALGYFIQICVQKRRKKNQIVNKMLPS